MGTNTEELKLIGYDNAHVQGNDNDNTIFGNYGDTTFEGKGGNDYLESTLGGDDTYIFNLGDGYDYIKDLGGADTVKFGEGITPQNIVMLRNLSNNNLEIWFNIEGENCGITIENYFGDDENKIERFEFADGTVITDITQYIKVYGSDEDITLPETIKEAHLRGEGNTSAIGNDLDNWLGGNSGDNTFYGGKGDDTFWDDQDSSERYLYNIGDGHDFIGDVGGLDAIIFGEDVTKDNILFSKDENNLIISFTDNENDSICIANYFDDDENKIEFFRFANGDVISDISSYLQNENGEVAQIVGNGSIVLVDGEETATLSGTNNATVLGNNLDNTIIGNSGNNTYYASGGDDIVTDVLGGNDTYIYNIGDGEDSVTDIGGNDTIKFGQGITLDNLTFENISSDLKINIQNDDGYYGCIFVTRHFKSDYRKIEHFEFADGTIISDLTPYLTGTTVKSDYVIDEGSSIKDVYLQGNKDISVVGNSADNHFEGNSGDNTYEGKGGDDNIWDESGGNDTYIYNLGDGFDWIHDKSGNDTIQFGVGITADDIKFVKNGNSLEIRIGSDENYGNIWVDNYFDSSNDYKIENVKFANGTTITDVSDKLYGLFSESDNVILTGNMVEGGVSGDQNLNVTGNDLDNWLNGNAGNNIMTGGRGDDNFYDDQGGNDTYIYNLGDGNDSITDINGNDTIQFGEGITANNVSFNQTADGHLEIRFAGQEGSIFIDDYFNENEDKKIENFKFADGTTLTDISSLIIPYTENGSAEGEIEENIINNLIQEINTYAPEGEMSVGEYNQNNDELLQLVAC